MIDFIKTLIAMHQDEEGQGLVEYGLILALVSVVAIAALTALGGGVGGVLNEVTGAF
jgi:pilus assembly protein Flp/PilA